MKLTAFALALMPGIVFASSWTSQGFPPFTAEGTGKFVSHAALTKGTRPLTLHIDQQCWQPADAIKLNQMLSLKPCEGTPPQWRLFKDGDYSLEIDTRSGTPTLTLSIKSTADPVASTVRQCPTVERLAADPGGESHLPGRRGRARLLQPANRYR